MNYTTKIKHFFIVLFGLGIFANTNYATGLSEGINGKYILVTAPSNYAKSLSNLIKEKGGIPVLMPTVETAINPDTKAIDNLLRNIDSVNWVVLPSRMAIDAFFSRIAANSVSKKALKKVKFCALGNDINYLKENFRVNVAFHPSEAGPNGIVEALKNQPNIQNQNLWIVAPLVIGVTEPNVIPNFIRDLNHLGLRVQKAEGYITRIADPKKYNEQLDLLKNGQIDLIAFTSTAEIEALIKITSIETIENQIVACFGPYTGKNAQLLGLNPEFIGTEFHSFVDFVNGIDQFFRNK
ncbi:MAG TPA: uroporphyrinogen III synthase [Bacteroidales bacterium]|nr:uroporphyrinogen III synthase [Bacteroidales bacterium]